MDKRADKRWDWLPAHMPTVAAMVRRKRAELGDAHVNECWRRGVVEAEPGWFYAREGALAVGAPFTDPDLAALAMAPTVPTQAVLLVRPPDVQGAADGA